MEYGMLEHATAYHSIHHTSKLRYTVLYGENTLLCGKLLCIQTKSSENIHASFWFISSFQSHIPSRIPANRPAMLGFETAGAASLVGLLNSQSISLPTISCPCGLIIHMSHALAEPLLQPYEIELDTVRHSATDVLPSERRK